MDSNVAGIYLIINTVNGKVYVGQTLNIRQRWRNQKNLRGGCSLLHRAMKKYGIENFKFEILETLDKNTNLFIDDDLNRLEIEYIKIYHSFRGDPLCNGYNLTTGGDRPAAMDDESRQRAIAGMKKYWSTPEAREKARKAKLGKPGERWSDERRKRVSTSKKGKPLLLTDEAKQRSVESRRLRNQHILLSRWELIKDLDRSKYGWTIEVSKQTGLSCQTIRSVCRKLGVPVKVSKGGYN